METPYNWRVSAKRVGTLRQPFDFAQGYRLRQGRL